MLPGVAPMVDNLFLLAVAALGWGLSLATYRLFARSRGWPMGALQADLPFVPVLIGLAGLFSGLLFATARGAADGGWMIIAWVSSLPPSGLGFCVSVRSSRCSWLPLRRSCCCWVGLPPAPRRDCGLSRVPKDRAFRRS